MWDRGKTISRENHPPSYNQPFPFFSSGVNLPRSAANCQKDTPRRKERVFLVFIFHLLLWESSGGISGNFSLVFSPEAPLRSKLAKWLIALPGITTPPSTPSKKWKAATATLAFPLFHAFMAVYCRYQGKGGKSGVGSLGQMRLGEREKARLASEDPSSLRSRRRRKCAWLLPEFTVSQIGI